MRIVFPGLSCSAAVLVLGLCAAPAFADDTDDANALFVAAMLAWDQAEATADDALRLRLLEQVDQNLQQIIAEHPGADLAVKLVIGEAIGPLSVPVVRAALTEAEAVAAVAQVWTDCMANPTPACIMAEVDRQSLSVPEAQTDNVIIYNAVQVEATAGQFDSAMAKVDQMGGYFRDQAIRDIAIAQAKAGQGSDAHATADRIESLSTRTRTLVSLAKAEHALSLPDQARSTLMGAYKATAAETDPDEQNRLREAVIVALAELAFAEEAVSFARTIEPPEDRDSVLLRIVFAQASAGQIDEAIATSGLIAAPGTLESAHGTIAGAEASQGRTADALERAAGITDPLDQAWTWAEIVVGLAANGEMALAEETLARAMTVVAEQDDSWLRFNSFRYVGMAQASLGQAEAAGHSMDVAMTAAIDLGEGDFRYMAMAFLAEDMAKAGLPDLARRVLEQARDIAQAMPADDDRKVQILTDLAIAARRIDLNDLGTAILQHAVEAALERTEAIDRITDLSGIAGNLSRPVL